MDTEVAWYFRVFYIYIVSTALSFLLPAIIRPKRMGMPEMTRPMRVVSMVSFIGLCVWLWFIPFSINPAFWIGIVVIVFGLVVFALGFIAMREHPEKKQVIVDWGIYGASRHSHLLAGVIITLGVIIIGWNTQSMLYLFLWLYFVLDIVFTHFAILYEEKRNVEKFGQEYVDYMKRVPRYFSIKQ
jgi:protein-S-isoprenylcysteine O-methyltransferase Ste14